MLRIYWRSKITDATGHGEPLQADVARKEVEGLNREWPDLIHWAAE